MILISYHALILLTIERQLRLFKVVKEAQKTAMDKKVGGLL